MTPQTRWLCLACAREWVYAARWDPMHGCPACRSPRIERRTYAAAFPGGDLPRGDVAVMADPPPRATATPPPIALTANEAIPELA